MNGPLSLEGSGIATAGGRMVLVTRNGGSGAEVANGPFAWADLSGVIVGAPAAVYDASGRLVVLAFGSDAHLHTRRATVTGTPKSFTG